MQMAWLILVLGDHYKQFLCMCNQMYFYDSVAKLILKHDNPQKSDKLYNSEPGTFEFCASLIILTVNRWTGMH